MPAAGDGDSVQALVEQMAAAAAQDAVAPRRVGSRVAELLVRIWSLVLQGDAQRDALLKLAVLPRLLALMESSAASGSDAAYAAAGVLAALAGSAKGLAELTAGGASTNRLIAACVALLQGQHDRSRLPAAQLLAAVATQPQLVSRIAPALEPLLALLAGAGGPGWAGSQQLAASLLRVLAALLEPSECESMETKQARRQQCLAAGAVQALACQVLGPSCSNTQLLLPATACLRFLALSPAAAKVFLSEQVLARLLQLLCVPDCHPGVAAYVCGSLWQMAAAPAAAEALVQAGAVPVLMGVVSAMAGAAAAASPTRRRSTQAGGRGGGRSSGGQQQQQQQQQQAAPPAAAGRTSSARTSGASGVVPTSQLLQDPAAATAIALCNATGALHHLSFDDGAKQQMACSPHLAVLARLASGSGRGQSYDNAVGVLWHVSLLAGCQAALAAAGAPAHLLQPLPPRWITAPPVASGSAGGNNAVAAAAQQAAPVAGATSTRAAGPQPKASTAAWRPGGGDTTMAPT